MEFDTKTSEHLKYYVYALIDAEGRIFYVGKGKGNRVFDHVRCALIEETESNKYDTIRRIQQGGGEVRYIVVRHGMDEKTAFEVESALIDLVDYLGVPLTNIMSGHHSIENGLMSARDIISKYNAEPLNQLHHPVMIININKTYRRGSGLDGIYEATRKSWVVSEARRKSVQYALAEYRGFIAEVFSIEKWAPADDQKLSDKSKRWQFFGHVAPDHVREVYVNKTIAHLKRRGAANPIRYNLGDKPYDPKDKFQGVFDKRFNEDALKFMKSNNIKPQR